MHLADAFEREDGKELTEEDARDAVDDLQIEFSFRKDRLDPEKAEKLYAKVCSFAHDPAILLTIAKGFLTGEAYSQILMSEYGLSHTDIVVPMVPVMPPSPQSADGKPGKKVPAPVPTPAAAAPALAPKKRRPPQETARASKRSPPKKRRRLSPRTLFKTTPTKSSFLDGDAADTRKVSKTTARV
jgi:hypothetical protein